MAYTFVISIKCNQENFNTLLFVIEWYNYDQAKPFIYRTISPIEFDYGDLFERLLLTSSLVFFHNFCFFFLKLFIRCVLLFILQSVHLPYKYAIRINFCFIRTRRINFSAYEYIFLVPCSYVQRRAQTSMKLVLM